VCGSSTFLKADFAVRGMFPLFAQGSIHEEKLKVEERDMENYRKMVNRGLIPMYLTTDMLKKAIGK